MRIHIYLISGRIKEGPDSPDSSVHCTEMRQRVRVAPRLVYRIIYETSRAFCPACSGPTGAMPKPGTLEIPVWLSDEIVIRNRNYMQDRTLSSRFAKGARLPFRIIKNDQMSILAEIDIDKSVFISILQ